MTDCPDQSDEADCDLLQLDDDYRNDELLYISTYLSNYLLSIYRNELFPRSPDNNALLIYVSVEILALPEIDTLGLTFTADFDLMMRWVDQRLVFFDLRGTAELNSLSSKVQRNIWSPKLSFTNAKIIGGTLVDDTTTTVIARKCLCPAPDDVRMAVESNVYEGIKSNILQKREYFIDWTCDYNLLFYPFDTQVCHISP